MPNYTANRREANPFSHLPPDTPVYRLINPCFLEDDTLHAEDEEIAYLGTPNESMEPLNEAARQRMQAYLDMLDDAQRAVDAKHNREFRGRPTDFADAIPRLHADAKADATAAAEGKKRKALVMPAQRGAVPVRGDTVQGQKARQAASGVLAVKTPKAVRERRLGPTDIIGITNRMQVPEDPGSSNT